MKVKQFENTVIFERILDFHWRIPSNRSFGITSQLVSSPWMARNLCAFEGIAAFNEPVHINARPTKLNSLFLAPNAAAAKKGEKNNKWKKAKQKFLANGNFLLFHLFACLYSPE